jgi:S1-C subfamily serine protease
VPFVEKNVAANHQAAMEMIQISGQQGVPVITIDGQVVIGFNQPRLMELLKPKLGASVADAASQRKKHPGIPAAGAFVGRVRPGSAADKAGLKKGDVIVALGGQRVGKANDLHRLISEMPKGRDLSLTYVRDGRQHDTLVRL